MTFLSFFYFFALGFYLYRIWFIKLSSEVFILIIFEVSVTQWSQDHTLSNTPSETQSIIIGIRAALFHNSIMKKISLHKNLPLQELNLPLRVWIVTRAMERDFIILWNATSPSLVAYQNSGLYKCLSLSFALWHAQMFNYSLFRTQVHQLFTYCICK